MRHFLDQKVILRYGINILPVFLAIIFLFNSFEPAYSKQILNTYSPSGKPFFKFDIYDQGEIYYIDPDDGFVGVSAWTLEDAHLRSLQYASDYWSSILDGSTKNTLPVSLVVGALDVPGAVAIAPQTATGTTLLYEALLYDRYPDNLLSGMAMGFNIANGYENYLGPLSVLPKNKNSQNMTSALVHELGHVLGLGAEKNYDGTTYTFANTLAPWDRYLVDSFGNKSRPNLPIIQGSMADPNAFVVDSSNYKFELYPDGSFYYTPGANIFFQGKNTMEALGGANTVLVDGYYNPHNIAGLPISAFEPDMSIGTIFEGAHIELRNSLMSHQWYRNWGTLMEAELAVLQDIGYPIDRKNFFGHSLYTDNNDLDLTLGFYARNEAGKAYIPGIYNTSPLSVGLHLYGTGNTIRAQGEVLAAGSGGVGIRVDGWQNNLTLMPTAKIHSLGVNSTGLLGAYGRNHNFVHRGEIIANGAGGIGASFDFGSNIMGSYDAVKGSYIDYIIYELGYYHFPLEFVSQDSLVDSFDISGTLVGDAASIYISDNAHVKQINVMQGTSLSGDIISNWDPNSSLIQYNGPRSDLATSLTFGLAADATGKATGVADQKFFLDYRDNIIGPKSLQVELAGGSLAYGGAMDVLSFTANDDSSLLVLPSFDGVSIKAPDLTLSTNSTVGLYTDTITYGAPLKSNQTVLKLEGDRINNSAILERPTNTFMHGFDDYSPTSLGWEGNNLVLGSIRTRSKERAAESALTAPAAIMLDAPYSKFFHERAATIFSELRDTNATLQAQAENGLEDISTVAEEPEEITEELEKSDGASLWITSSYTDTKRHGANRASIYTPGLGLGADMRVGDSAFLGLGAYLSKPFYRSDAADLDAESFAAFIYGGSKLPLSLELDGFVGIGQTRYEQQRSVYGLEHYEAEYSGKHAAAGLALSRPFVLEEKLMARPFASYEFMRLEVNGYDEGDAGLFGLEVGDSQASLHRLQAGTSLSYTLEKGFLEGKLFYSGLYGDRTTRADLTMNRDPSAYTLRGSGWAQDKHSAGVGLGFDLNFWDTARFSGGYTFTGGKNITSHQLDMTLAIPF